MVEWTAQQLLRHMIRLTRPPGASKTHRNLRHSFASQVLNLAQDQKVTSEPFGDISNTGLVQGPQLKRDMGAL